MSEISYSKKNDRIECVRYKDWRKSYPPHTHTGHLTVGYIEEGSICLVMNGVTEIYGAGDKFQIPPDVLHEIRMVDGQSYSMVVLCIAVDDAASGGALSGALSGAFEREYEDAVARLSELRKSILENPENIYLIEQMAHDACISPFHMIREFKKAFGLTPHQFQMQCKVRKAQKLLAERSASEVTFDAGFYDQSHMDRCFKKVVGLSPKEYKKAVKPATDPD
ncbi:MAG: AraC family transcriptional regulator [Fibrobacter sp.]|uniref:helix-turn-helix domain-containing protein n=1 Tax=Fibrobacter sp. TaxID=35828 RepID=UPI0025C0778C|nr:AraC family transcriptional regulator [Fibrobacter sp.]MBR4785124.1 AraC family transcriptional regulator [Fibrobacter sp.]